MQNLLSLSFITLSGLALTSVAPSPPIQDAKGQEQVSPWVSLFDGKTLDGWTQRNGTATYTAENGTIQGQTANGSPNSFLCTNRDYSDFELTFDVQVDNALNSGVQIRSQTRDGFLGRVNGPQVEIEASGPGGGEAGYLYGEAAGGWMTPDKSRTLHKHFLDGKWNSYRVLAVGPRIQVWVNGTQTSDLTHEKIYGSHPRGFIGLQVHSVGHQITPLKVSWRNIRLREIRDPKAGWVQLYNGKDLTHWTTSGNWLPQPKGELLLQPRPGEKGWERFSDYLWSDKQYANFILDIEYAYPAKGNSGIYFRVGDRNDPVAQGIEAQILDSTSHKGDLTHHDHGGIIMTSPPSKNMSLAPGKWNRMIVTARNQHLEVDLNGERIIDLQLNKTGLKDRPMKGYIGLQDHGEPHAMRFRKIWVREL